MIVFLYNYWNIYNLIYHAFKPVRVIIPLPRVPGGVVRLLQPFAKSHLGQSLDEAQLRNLLGDKLWTPQATFHSVSEVRRWGREEGLTLTKVKKFYLGYANVMQFVKLGGNRSGTPKELTLKCSACGAFPMSKGDGEYQCSGCGCSYRLDGEVISTLSSSAPPAGAHPPLSS